VNHVCSVKKTPELTLCVFIADYIVYSGFGVNLQQSYCMCDVM